MIHTKVHMLGGPLDGKTITISTTMEWLPERISSGSYIYERLDDPDTGAFLGGYFLSELKQEGDIVARDKIRRMPAPEFERRKRRVPIKLYAAIVLPLGLLWLWIDPAKEFHWATTILIMTGLYTIAQVIGRFIMTERAISQELGTLKKNQA